MCRTRENAGLTLLPLHAVRLEPLVQQPDPQPHVHAHLLLVNLSRDPVLHQDVRRVGPQLIPAVRDLGHDLAVPLALRLARRHEPPHHQPVDLPPVLACASRNVRDDISVAPLVEPWLVADGALADLDDVLLAAVLRELVLGREVALVAGRAHLGDHHRRRLAAGALRPGDVYPGRRLHRGRGTRRARRRLGAGLEVAAGVQPPDATGGPRPRPRLQLLLEADDDLVHREVLLLAIIVDAVREPLEEAVDGRLAQCRAERVEHRRQLDLADEAALVGVVLLDHGSPELLSQRGVWHVLGTQGQHGVVLVLPLVQVLHLERQRELVEVGGVGLRGGRIALRRSVGRDEVGALRSRA